MLKPQINDIFMHYLWISIYLSSKKDPRITLFTMLKALSEMKSSRRGTGNGFVQKWVICGAGAFWVLPPNFTWSKGKY